MLAYNFTRSAARPLFLAVKMSSANRGIRLTLEHQMGPLEWMEWLELNVIPAEALAPDCNDAWLQGSTCLLASPWLVEHRYVREFGNIKIV